MPETTVLRVEVTQTTSGDETSLSSRTTSSAVAGGIAGAALTGGGKPRTSGELSKQAQQRTDMRAATGANFVEGKGVIGGTYQGFRHRRLAKQFNHQAMQQQGYKNLFAMARYDSSMADAATAREYSSMNFGIAGDALKKHVKTGASIGLKGATGAVGLYSVYSNYQKVGYQLSGASSAAARQDRNQQTASTGLMLGVAAVANPYLLPLVLVSKAWQLAQTNRQEIFKIQASQIMANIQQRNLIRDSVERRF